MKIGVLAVQGDFIEHAIALQKLEVSATMVRRLKQLEGLNGLILPGGESTSISKLMRNYDLTAEIIKLAREGLPVFGTCAGMVLMANDIPDNSVESLGLMDITVKRNAFGRQRESFETELKVPVLGEEPFPGVFIRAPLIERVRDSVEVLSRLDGGTCVAARQANLLALAFHPELTEDLRFHQYFLDIVSASR